MVSIATMGEVRQIIALAKQYDGGFSKHVKVDVEYATGAYINLVKNGICVIFALKEDNEIIGGLAALKYPDINNGTMTAVECFWFVNPDKRGNGMALLDAFEAWGAENNCGRLALIHLVDSYPETLKKLYQRKGYVLIESHYVKELQK